MHAHKNAQTQRKYGVSLLGNMLCESTNNIWIVTALLLIMTLGK